MSGHHTIQQADEVTTLRGFLDHYRDTVRRQCGGLTTDQLATPLPPSTMTLGGLMKHLAYVEQWWFRTMLLGEQPSGVWADVDWEADEDWDWHSAGEQTPDELRALFDEEVAGADRAVEQALADGGMETVAVGRRHGAPVTLRWILVHMVEEYARHAGHADLLREHVDGSTRL